METSTLELNGFKYNVTQLDGIKGRRNFVKLANVLGPAMKLVAPNVKSLGDVKLALMAASVSLLADLKAEDLDHFCDLFGETTTLEGPGIPEGNKPLLKGQLFMTHFAGNYFAMFEWLSHCISANYASFFSEIAALLSQHTATEVPAKASELISPEHLDWFFYRLIVSKHVSVKWTDFQHMSCEEINNMHDFLDVYEPAYARANRPRGGGGEP